VSDVYDIEAGVQESSGPSFGGVQTVTWRQRRASTEAHRNYMKSLEASVSRGTYYYS